MENSNRQTRLLLALFLSMGVWFFINQAFFPPIEKPKKKAQVFQNNPSTEKVEKLSISKKSKTPTSIKEENKLKKDIPNKKVYIITNPFIVEFNNLGARIERFYLKDHKNAEGENVWLVRDKEKILTFNNQKYKAIEISREKGFDFNFFSNIRRKISNSELNQTIFETNFDPKNLKIEFKTTLPYNTNVIFIKEYQFFKEENYFKVSVKFVNTIDETVVLSSRNNSLYFRSFGSLGRSEKIDTAGLDFSRYFRFYYSDNSFQDYIDGTTSKGFMNRMFNSSSDETFSVFKSENQKIDFVGSGSRYFVAVCNPLNDLPSSVVLDNRENNTTGVLMLYDSLVLKPDSELQFDYAAYIGLRENSSVLFHNQDLDPFQNSNSPFRGLSPELDESFNQGLTTPFRNAIVWILKKFYFVVPNYGWCIIIFAIIFKLFFYPLNQKQANSMKKMQELSPELKEITERYKDPKKRQEKTLEIYKKHKVNPMSGCLPILIQIPIFIALYTAFSDTIDLWRSPFLWIGDLSEPDTVFKTKSFWFFNNGFSLNILPLIMVGTQFFQTKMTAVTTDPNQKTIMYVMPVIMLYFFWSMPSGLTLYWTIQNILSIIQQYITNQTKSTDKILTKKGKKI